MSNLRRASLETVDEGTSSSTHDEGVGSLAYRLDGDLLTINDVAELLQISVNTLRWWRQAGTGPAFFKIGRHLVTTVSDLRAWIEEQRQSPDPGVA